MMLVCITMHGAWFDLCWQHPHTYRTLPRTLTSTCLMLPASVSAHCWTLSGCAVSSSVMCSLAPYCWRSSCRCCALLALRVVATTVLSLLRKRLTRPRPMPLRSTQWHQSRCWACGYVLLDVACWFTTAWVCSAA
jgi:hypothetical protein